MTEFLLNLLINSIAIYIAAKILKGVELRNFMHAFLAAIFLAAANAVLKPILIFLTIPVTILTLGLFILVINALIIMLVDWILPGLKIRNFWWALLFYLLISLLNAILNWILLI
jgi:putative membrane protein